MANESSQFPKSPRKRRKSHQSNLKSYLSIFTLCNTTIKFPLDRQQKNEIITCASSTFYLICSSSQMTDASSPVECPWNLNRLQNKFLCVCSITVIQTYTGDLINSLTSTESTQRTLFGNIYVHGR